MKIAPEPSTSKSTPCRCPIHPNVALGSRRSQCPICAIKGKRRRGKSLAPGARHARDNESHVSTTRIHRCDDKQQQGWKWNEKIDVRNIMNKTVTMPTKSNATKSGGSGVTLLPFRQPRASSDVETNNGSQEKDREPVGFKTSTSKAKRTSSQKTKKKKKRPDPPASTRVCSRSARSGPSAPSSPRSVSEVPRDDVSQPKQVGRSNQDQQKDDMAIKTDAAYNLAREYSDRIINSVINYKPGQNLSCEEHSIPFTSSSQAYALLTKLPLYSHLFVKRTSGEWTCGLLADRLLNHHGRDCLVVFFKSSGEKKKILEKIKWERYLRLVKGHAASEALLSYAAAADADCANGRKSRGRGKQSAVSRLISIRRRSISRSLSRKRGKRRSSTKKHDQTNRYNDAGSTSNGGATLSSSITSATICASATASLIGSFATITSLASSFHKNSSAPPIKSVSFHNDTAPSSDGIIINMDMVNADPLPFATEPANVGGSSSHKNQEFVLPSASKTSRSKNRPQYAGDVAKSMPQLSTIDPSPIPDQAQSSLPIATNINLNAKTFIGSRRDRMRPRARRTRSKSRVRVFSPSRKIRLGKS